MIKDIAPALLGWYDQHRRSLPWRAEMGEIADPYHVWMSEIMLQQTTVATVKSYFEKFLRLWPTVMDLAASPQEDILREWAGLGYYARARNLHKCAGVIANEHSGIFPDSYDQLITLPGIGDYTAAAIASIAFGKSKAVVDGNVERVVSRLYRITEELPKAKAPIKAKTVKLTPKERAGDYAQAMMDLGSSICTPKNPKCAQCPLNSYCKAYKQGDAQTYPRKAPKKARPVRRSIAFYLICDDHIYLERRPEKGLLGGMLGLPHGPWVERATIPTLDEAETSAPIKATWSKLNGMASHTFTHFHLEIEVYLGELKTKPNSLKGEWHAIKTINKAGLPTVFKKMVALR